MRVGGWLMAGLLGVVAAQGTAQMTNYKDLYSAAEQGDCASYFVLIGGVFAGDLEFSAGVGA